MEKGSAQQSPDESWRRGGHLTRMSHLLDSGYMADVTFILTDRKGEETRIPAHRLHLSHASPVLEAMLSETWRAQESREIRIEGVTAECFRLLLGYVYTGQTPDLDMDSALELLGAAHMYLVSDLLDSCIAHITASLSAEKVCQVLEVASTLSLDGLHSIALKFVVENTSAVLRTASFPECSAASLRLILEQDSLSLSSELELVQACVRWGQHKAEQGEEGGMEGPLKVRAALGELVFLLRLRGLSSEEVALHVVPGGLLTKDEQIALFCCVATKGNPMPGGFTDKIRTCLDKPALAGQSVCQTCVDQLFAATNRGDFQTVKRLLGAKVTVDCKHDGFTALMYAVIRGNVELVRLLLDRGADPEHKDRYQNNTAIYFAALFDHTQVAKLLIERGCNVNVTNKNGDTPLLCAIEVSSSEMVHVLLEGGADPRITNSKGETPLALAALQAGRETDMVSAIRKYL